MYLSSEGNLEVDHWLQFHSTTHCGVAWRLLNGAWKYYEKSSIFWWRWKKKIREDKCIWKSHELFGETNIIFRGIW